MKNLMNLKFENKKLLLLGGASHHRKVVKTAQEMGVYVLCTDYTIDSPAKKIADESLMIDVKDIESLTDLCMREQVDGVLNVYLDPCQRPHQQICETLNYPCYGDHYQFSIMTDKRNFKKFCIQNGVDVIPEYDYDAMDNDYSNIEFPVIVKPADGRGARGQTICNDIDEIRKAVPFAKEHSTGGVLIEKYMGRENDLMISYLVVDNEPYLIRVTDRHLGKPEDSLERVAIAAVTPSRFTKFYLDNVNRNVKKMIKNLGIQNGPVFMQGFVDGNTVRFYDPGLRLPGSEFEVSYKKIFGIDFVEMLIEFALTGSILGNLGGSADHIYLDGHFVLSLYPAVRAGIIHKITGLDAIKTMENLVSFSQYYYEGDEVFRTNDTRQRFCAIDLIAPSWNELKASIELIQTTLKVLDKDGNNLIYGNF